MKKILRIIFFILIMMITFSIANVKAESDKTIIVELPSNEFDDTFYVFGNMSIRQLMTTGFIGQYEDEEFLYNQQGKPINKIYKNNNNSSFHYELLDGVTKEDCIYEIKDAMTILNSNTSSDSEIMKSFFKKILDGYDKIQVVVKEFPPPKKIDEIYVIDLTKNNSYDITFFDSFLLSEVLEENYLDKMGYEFIISNNNHKKICTINMDIFEGEPVIKTTIPEDVTDEDDIIIELTDEDKNYLRSNSSIDFDNYSRIIIRTGNKQYLDSDYVIDVNDINFENFSDYSPILFSMYTRFNNFYFDFFYRINDNNDKTILKIEYAFLEFLVAEPTENATYKDNIIIDIDDELNETLQNSLFGERDKNYKQIILKLKEPEFFEGQSQTLYKNNKDDMSFALTINKDELDESGTIYIDGNLVDKNNYVLSSNVKGVTLTLKKEYVDNLDSGTHEIKVKVLYGDALSLFKIEEKIINPETGSKILSCLILMFISLILLTIFYKKKNLNM